MVPNRAITANGPDAEEWLELVDRLRSWLAVHNLSTCHGMSRLVTAAGDQQQHTCHFLSLYIV